VLKRLSCCGVKSLDRQAKRFESGAPKDLAFAVRAGIDIIARQIAQDRARLLVDQLRAL